MKLRDTDGARRRIIALSIALGLQDSIIMDRYRAVVLDLVVRYLCDVCEVCNRI